MTLPLPILDDRTYEDLVEEAVGLIPALDPEWTNHNPSDPGITLIELLAWLAEMLIYRANRVTDQHLVTFLRLLNGPDWPASGAGKNLASEELNQEIRRTLCELTRPQRAVTCSDYETLATDLEQVVRAKCIPRRNLGADWSTRPVPEFVFVSVAVLQKAADSNGWPQPADSHLIKEVHAKLQPRRLLAARLSVVAAEYVAIHANVEVVRQRGVSETTIADGEKKSLVDFLHPLRGGPDKQGWPFGRTVRVSELFGVLERTSVVDFVKGISLGVIGSAGASQSSLQERVDLLDYQLPKLEEDQIQVTVSTS